MKKEEQREGEGEGEGEEEEDPRSKHSLVAASVRRLVGLSPFFSFLSFSFLRLRLGSRRRNLGEEEEEEEHYAEDVH